MELTFDAIRNSGLLIYEYVRGSHAYGTNVETSDVDTGGIYISPPSQLLGLGFDWQDEVSDDKHDTTWYSLKKFMSLLAKSNPTVLEALFVPDRCVIFEHPIMTEIKKNRDKYLTKECFNAFVGYAIAQIKKSKGYNKLCNWEEVKRKEPLDFCYTFYKQGTSNIKNWLEKRHLKQKYCGLCNCNHTRDAYALFYDWGSMFEDEGRDMWAKQLTESFLKYKAGDEYSHLIALIFKIIGNPQCPQNGDSKENLLLMDWFEKQKPIGYRGIVSETWDSNDVRCSSIEKYAEPICHLIYNRDEYSHHCVKYRQYTEWLEHRNEARYLQNKGKDFDRKNAMHTIRLLHMGIEVASGKGFNVDRTGIDREFLLDIRNGNTTYDEFISYVEGKKDELDKLIPSCGLPETVDVGFINSIYKQIVKNQLKKCL